MILSPTNPTLLLVLLTLTAGEPAGDSATGESYEGSRVAYRQFVFAYTNLQTAQRSGDARDWELTSDAFDAFLDRYPDEPLRADALYYRALIAHLQGDDRVAAWHLGKAGRPVMVGDNAMHLLRGQVAAAMSKHAGAVKHLLKVDVKKLEPDLQATVWLELGSAYQRLTKLLAAVGALENASAIKGPFQSRALLQLADLQARLGRRLDALKSLRRCLALDDDKVTPDAAWLAGDLQFKLHKYTKAAGHFQTVIGFPTSERFNRSIVDLMWAQLKAEQNDLLLATFEKYGQLLPTSRHLEAWTLAATAHQNKGEHNRAAVLLQAVINTKAGSKLEDQVLYKLAESQFAVGLYKNMRDNLARLRAGYPDSLYLPDADFLLANADARQGKLDQAAAGFTAIIQAGPTPGPTPGLAPGLAPGPAHRYYAQAVRQRAWLYELAQRFEPAIADYRRILEQELADEKILANEIAPRLINLYTKTKQYRQAVELAEQLLGIDLPSAAADLEPGIEQEVLYRWGWALIKLEQFDRAHQALDTLLDKHPLNPYRTEALYWDGVMLMTLERPDEAVTVLAEALKSDKLGAAQRTNALRLSALHWHKTGQYEQAADAMLKLHEHSKGKALRDDERLWLGRHLQQHERYDKAIDILGPLVSRNPDIPSALRSESLLIIARSLRGRGDLDKAANTFSQVISLADKFELVAWLEMADTLKDAERYDEALGEYTGLMTVEQTSVAAQAMLHCAQVHRAVAHQRALAQNSDGAAAFNTEARKVLLRMIILHSVPQISPLPELARIELAEVELDLGRADQAAALYQQLADDYADTAYGLYARAMLALDAGRRAEAMTMLRKLQADKPDDRLSRRVALHLSMAESLP